MRFYLRLTFLVCFLALGIYFVAGWLTNIRASDKAFFSSDLQNTAEDKQSTNARITLKILTENCGSCHQSTLPTAKPKALEIFDLDKKPWYSSVPDKYLEKISQRISTKSDLSDSDRTAILDFFACVRKGECKDKD